MVIPPVSSPFEPRQSLDGQRLGRRAIALLIVPAYLGCIGWFLLQHALGDPYSRRFAYFWTWDMFPGYAMHTTRRLAIGTTAQGHYVALLPGPLQRYRGGAAGNLPRSDLERSGGSWRRIAEKSLAKTRAAQAGDPIVHVVLVEQYRPARLNLPADIYEGLYGEPRPSRWYWRTVEEFDVAPPP